MYAINHNIKYLAILNQSNANELKLTQERLKAITQWNEKLQDENHRFQTENHILKEDQRILGQKREEMARMVIDSQANAKEIAELYENKTSQEEQQEKLNVEITVLVTEKLTQKKEMDRLMNDHRKLKSEFK